MMRKYFVCFLAVLLLITLPSCKKKEGSDGSSASAPATANAVVTGTSGKIDSPSKNNEASSLKEDEEEKRSEPLSLLDMTEQADDGVTEELYRGGKYLIKGFFDKESGELVFENATDDEILSILASFVTLNPEARDMTFVLENGTVTLSYSRMSRDERDEWWKEFVSFMNEYNASQDSDKTMIVPKAMETVKGNLESEIYPDKIVIGIPSGMSDDELSVFALYLVNSYPELMRLFTFEKDGTSVTLYYLDGTDNGLASEYFDYLGAEINSYFSRVEESVEEEVVEVAVAVEEEKTEALDPAAGEEESIIAQTEKGESVKKFSASLSVFGGYDTSTVALSFVSEAAFDYHINSSFAVGVSFGYDFTGYIPLSAQLRYYAPFADGLYFGGKAGAMFKVGDNTGTFGFLFGLSVGYEYKFNDSLSAFAEADALYIRLGDNHFRFGLTLGGRYSF